MRGDSRGCVAALGEAERTLTRVGDERPAEWIAGFDEGSLAGETALCLRQLGDLCEAQRHAERVIELRSGDRVRSRAFGQLTLAGVFADAGRPDEAAVIGLAVCDLMPSLTSARVRVRLDQLGNALQCHSSLSDVATFLACLAALNASEQEASRWPV